MVNSRSGLKFKERTTEISDNEIKAQYGSLITEAISAFMSDCSYLTDMANRANIISRKRVPA